MNDRDFLAAFEAASIGEFHHRDHIRAAWCSLREMPVLDALERFTTALKRFATSKGQPQLYHETITWAYVFLIHERMEIEESWDSFAARNADLFAWRPSILDRLYQPETIQSERAKRTFVFPDRPGSSA